MTIPTSDAGRGAVTVERVAIWGAAVLAVVALAGLAFGPGAEFRTATPTASFDATFDAEAGAVTLTHAGGDRLAASNTDQVTVIVTDGDTGAARTVTWATDDADFPIGQGASVTVDDPSVDADGDGNYLDGDASVGFYLETGDTVDVVWTGRLLGAPDEQTAVLDSVTLTEESG